MPSNLQKTHFKSPYYQGGNQLTKVHIENPLFKLSCIPLLAGWMYVSVRNMDFHFGTYLLSKMVCVCACAWEC